MKKFIFWTILSSFILMCGLFFIVPYAHAPGTPHDETSEGLPQNQVYYFDQHEVLGYFQRTQWIDTGELPYRDVRQEYPVLGVAFITIPRLFVQTAEAYVPAFIVLTVITWIALVAVTDRILRHVSLSRMRLVALALPSLLYFTVSRFDVFVALLLAVSLLLTLRKKFVWAMSILGLSMLAKWYPLLLIPFFAAYASHLGVARAQLKKGVCAALGLFGGITLLTVVVFGQEALFPYAFHAARGFEIGSFWSLFAKVGYELAPVVFPMIAIGITFILFAIELLPALHGWLSYDSIRTRIQSPRAFAGALVVVVGIFLTFGKIYSPQWEYWWLPLALLVVATRWEWLCVIVLDILNYIQFPLLYHTVGPYSFVFDVVVIARSLLLVYLLAMLVNRLQLWPQRKIEAA